MYLLLFFSSPLNGESPAEPQIHYSLTDEGRKWKLGYQANDKQMSIIEYIPEDETIDNWQDLMTIHYIKGVDIPPAFYYDLFIGQLKKAAAQNQIHSKIIQQDANSIFAEWWIKDNTKNDQHEWIRIFTNEDNIAILRFTTKNMKDVEALRKRWEKIISSATYS